MSRSRVRLFFTLPRRTEVLFGCALGLLLIGAWQIYRPGLTGAFLFDDFINLPALGYYGRVDNATAFWRYITSGFADPTGRPLALLSFLIDANNWPADPEPFKRTNILLHVLNGTLLCWLLLKLGRITTRPAWRVEAAALLGAGLWLLHPLWITTTLYVVQREAMLPATFVLLGLLGYLHGRARIATQPRRGVCWIFGSIGVCTLLAFLSKANGLLLPMFVAIIEHIYVRALPTCAAVPNRLKPCLAMAVYPATFGIFAYLLYMGYNGIVHGMPAFRPWSLGQRLLTEPRVLFDYLGLLVFPRPYSRGLFNDSFSVSTGLLHPWTTLPALLGCMGLIVFALRARRRFPALALAIVFYFAGQVMESTTIPLELYFEHRNYLPALLFFWPFALWLTHDGALARIKPALAIGALLLLAAETWFAATLWGEPHIQALVWAAQNPDSSRAQTYAAAAERSMGHYAQAETRLRAALKEHPDEIQLAINLLGVRCQRGAIADSDIAAAEVALRTGSNRGPLTFDWASEAIGFVRNHSCGGLDAATLQRLIDAARQNAQTTGAPGIQQDLLDLEGQLALAEGDRSKAEQKFLAALKVDPKPELALKQAAILGSMDLPEAGLQQLDYYSRVAPKDFTQRITSMEILHRWLLYKEGYWENEISHLRATLTEDAAHRPFSQGSVENDRSTTHVPTPLWN